MSTLNVGDTIFAPITSTGGAIIVIRISGTKTEEIAKTLFPTTTFKPRVTFVGDLMDIIHNTVLDNVLATYFVAPKSFTGEDVIEVAIHGSSYILRQFLTILEKIFGCRLAKAGEFTERAFLNGKIDLVQSEGILAMTKAQTEAQHRVASGMYSGTASNTFNHWRNEIIKIMSILEVNIDFEEEVPEAVQINIFYIINNLLNEIKSHLDASKVVSLASNGMDVAIVGSPNVGKSSIINRLAGEDVSIVTDIAGTTRDSVSAVLTIGGCLVRIFDTAGIRSNCQDTIEEEGIKRSIKHKEKSIFSIIVLDATTPKSMPKEIKIDPSDIIVFNKCDLTTELPNGLCISAKTGEGFLTLANEIEKRVKEYLNISFMPAILTDRHKNAMEKCVATLSSVTPKMPIELISEEFRFVAETLSSVLGFIRPNDVMDEVFRNFCVGK